MEIYLKYRNSLTPTPKSLGWGMEGGFLMQDTERNLWHVDRYDVFVLTVAFSAALASVFSEVPERWGYGGVLAVFAASLLVSDTLLHRYLRWHLTRRRRMLERELGIVPNVHFCGAPYTRGNGLCMSCYKCSTHSCDACDYEQGHS